MSVDFADVVFNGEVATDDLILYVEYGGRTYVSLPEIVTGTMARVDRDKNDELYITLDSGEEYYESHIRDVASDVDVDVENFEDYDAREIPGFDTEYDFILDSNGYLVAVRPAEEVVTNYALVLDSAWTQNGLRRGGQVEILMADGTTGTYDIDWNESRKAMDGIHIEAKGIDLGIDENTTDDLNLKLEAYLGSRDVVNDSNYETGMALGSLISYSLDEDDTLTIEYIYQGNTFDDYDDPNANATLEIADVNDSSTAGVGDNGEIVYIGRTEGKANQYQSENADAYSNGRGRIEVRGLVETNNAVDVATGYYMDGDNETNVVEKDRSDAHEVYAVDRNTIAFYFEDKDGDGRADSGEYGVATGWNEMETITGATHMQVYPALEKTSDGRYEATTLAEVILFDAMPDSVSNDYMLVLDRNAYTADDELWLNVVFEDGTVAEIQIDDIDSTSVKESYEDFDDFEDTNDFMKAYPYVENADGTYDIVGGEVYGSTFADLFRNGTVAYSNVLNEDGGVDDSNADYIAYDVDVANIWDVTGVDSANDEVVAGDFIRNVAVHAVIIDDDDEIRTAWIWDRPDSVDDPEEPDDSLIARTWANNVRTTSAETYTSIRTAVSNRVELSMSEAQANAANLELQLSADVEDDVRGQYVIYGDVDSDISADDFDVTADSFDEWYGDEGDNTRLFVFGEDAGQDLDDGNVIVICLEGTDGHTYYAAYEIVVD